MYRRAVTILNKQGLHARPAAEFVSLASDFAAKLTVGRPGEDGVNAKSIILVLSRGFSKGETVELWGEGEDEQAAVDALAALLESGAGEEKE